MDSSDKNLAIRNTQSNYNPWNLIFTRNRSDSESSVGSDNSNPPTNQTGTVSQFGRLGRQTSKNEKYLWMMWRS